jgi:hypothetical protein
MEENCQQRRCILKGQRSKLEMRESTADDIATGRGAGSGAGSSDSRPLVLAFLREGGWREFVAVALLSTVLFGLVFSFTRRLDADAPEFSLPWNHHKYIYMAEGHVFDFHIAPFCWRLLTPLLVHLLPLPTRVGFLVICFFSLVGTATLVYYIAKQMAWPEPYPLLALLLLFIPTFVCRQLAFNYWNVDPLQFFLVTLAIWAVASRRTLLFVVALTLGVATKESAIFAAPLFYSLNADRIIDVPWLRRTILAVAPAVAVLLAIRLLIPAWNNDPQYVAMLGENLSHVVGGKRIYGFSDSFREIGLVWLRHFSLLDIRLLTTFTFGILFILPLFALRANAKLCLRFAPFILLVYAQMLLASDGPRLLALAFLPFTLMSLNGLRLIAEAGPIDPLRLAALPLSIFALSLTNKTSNLPFDMEVIVFSALVGFWWWRRPILENKRG